MTELQGKCGREKYWNELDIDGRLERTRQYVKMLERRIQVMQNTVRKLSSHDHKDGRMMYNFDDRYGCSDESPRATSHDDFF